jgi:hypothetical protein
MELDADDGIHVGGMPQGERRGYRPVANEGATVVTLREGLARLPRCVSSSLAAASATTAG